jgi:hypothetical protein
MAAFAAAVWVALRYLRYEEFDSVRNAVLGGALRRAVTADLCVRQLEAAIHGALSIEECWCAFQSCGAGLALSRATMQVFGRTYTAHFSDSGTPEACWSLRVPLDGAGIIDLEIPFGAAPETVAPLAESLRAVLAPKLEALRPKLAFAAAATAGGRR